MARTKKRFRNKDHYRLGHHIIKLGRYKAKNVCLDEAVINNVVLRVDVLREVLEPTKRVKDVKTKYQRTARNGFRKLFFIPHLYRKRYYLEFAPVVREIRSRVDLSFSRLAANLCSMKLPRSWNVTVVIKHDLNATFTFVNEKPQKSVSFVQNDPYYKIEIDGASVALLGCPKRVRSVKDMEILLEIVNRMTLTDCMICKM